MRETLYIRGVRLPAEETDAWWGALPVARSLMAMDTLRFTQPVTFFVGENGAGKSTLLEAMAVAAGFNAEGGTRNFHFSTADTHSGLCRRLRLLRGAQREKDGFFLRAESFYNVATELERLEEVLPVLQHYGGKSLHDQSHGESFLALVLNRFGGHGLYLLDEPEAALSPARQLALLCALDKLVKAGSQFFIATHSPLLLAYPQADIFVLSEEGIVPTPYRDTEPYTLTRAFLNAPEKMLCALLEEP